MTDEPKSFTRRLGATEFGGFGIGHVGDPLATAKSLWSYRMRSWPFFTFIICGGIGLLALITVWILELVSLIEADFAVNRTAYDDSQTYALFALCIPLFGAFGLALVAAFTGRVLFRDFWTRVVFLVIIGVLVLFGGIGSIMSWYIAIGRLNSCLHKQQGTDFCKDEKSDLIATVVMIGVLIGNSIPIVIASVLIAFVNAWQWMAIGIQKEARKGPPSNPKVGRDTLAAADAETRKGLIWKWLEAKAIEQLPEAARKEGITLTNSMATSSSASSSYSQGDGLRARVGPAHRAAAADALAAARSDE